MNGVEVFIPLTKGYVATIDIEDWDKVRPYKWQAQSSKRGVGVCASRTEHERQPYFGSVRKAKTILMHVMLLGIKGADVDHRNGDRLDNRRHNLRSSTRSQNCANQKVRSTNTSGFKGVGWKKDMAAWAARICVNYRRFHLGYFSSAEEAARAYDTAAQQYFGEFAKLNFPNR